MNTPQASREGAPAQRTADGRHPRRSADITGYSAEELSQRSPLDIIHPDDRSYDAELLMPFFRGDSPADFNRKRFVRQDCLLVWVEVTAAMVRDAQGRALRTVGDSYFADCFRSSDNYTAHAATEYQPRDHDHAHALEMPHRVNRPP